MTTSASDPSVETDEQRQDAIIMRRFRKQLIAFTLLCLFSYPVLSLITWQVRIHGGADLRQHGSIFQHDPISEPGMYLLVWGLPVAVALWFVYGALATRIKCGELLWTGYRTATWVLIGGFVSFLSLYGSFILFACYQLMLEKLFP